MKDTRLQLDGATAVRLWVFEGDATRLERIITDVWRGLSTGAREAIATFWRNGDPKVELSNLWDSENCNAKLRGDGCTIKVSEEAFRNMPDDVARYVIAHELAHVFQKANGIWVRSGDDGGPLSFEREGVHWGDEPRLEDDADQTAGKWGFSPKERDWHVRLYLAKRGIRLPESNEPGEGEKA